MEMADGRTGMSEMASQVCLHLGSSLGKLELTVLECLHMAPPVWLSSVAGFTLAMEPRAPSVTGWGVGVRGTQGSFFTAARLPCSFAQTITKADLSSRVGVDQAFL